MMKKVLKILVILFLIKSGMVDAQIYDIVIKGGHIIDPKNKVDAAMDLAVKDGKIAMIAKNIDTWKSGK